VQKYVKTIIQKNTLELLMSQSNFNVLFKAFNFMYDHHDAEAVFSWTIKYLIYFDIVKKFILFRDFYWVKDDNFLYLRIFILIWRKVFFLNLIVKMKIHLNNSRVEKSNRISLFNFYDVFSHFLKFVIIKSRDFKLRSHRKRISKIESSQIVEKFESIENEMNAFDSKKECI
jgi:hypothetical protein